MKDEVDVLDSPSQIVPSVSVDRKLELAYSQNSGAVWWTSWTPRPK